MSSPLRGAEIDACVHRIALVRAEPLSAERSPVSPEMQRRRRDAERHRGAVLERLTQLHRGAVVSSGHDHTRELMAAGTELILRPRIIDTDDARRSAAVQALVRVGRDDQRFAYAPLIVKNHEVIERAPSRQLYEGNLEHLVPGDVEPREGFGLRSTATVRRDGLLLSGALRILQSLGHADHFSRGALIDRQRRLWWLDLASATYARCNLDAYDELYRERLEVLVALDEWARRGGDFPTAPYWHRDCLTCEFSAHCEEELEAVDDVSLTRFTTHDQQRTLRELGVTTRRTLAHLDPVAARRARLGALHAKSSHVVETALVRSIDKLDDLIYRARSHERASLLRRVEPSLMGCPTADVEVDVDMESFDDITYLWGAYVTSNHPLEGVHRGYHAFVDWGPLDAAREARIFADFWAWFSGVRGACRDQSRTFSAYCFWAQAEDGAMNRAVSSPLDAGPTAHDLAEFRQRVPVEWIDLHELAKRQIQTDGPTGLKQLAAAAGFAWRDANPSGEASMLWYEEAVRAESEDALPSRERLLQYNEDDCRATKALREWLNGAAQTLPHRDDPL